MPAETRRRATRRHLPVCGCLGLPRQRSLVWRDSWHPALDGLAVAVVFLPEPPLEIVLFPSAHEGIPGERADDRIENREWRTNEKPDRDPLTDAGDRHW